jgi:hypothetical protein
MVCNLIPSKVKQSAVAVTSVDMKSCREMKLNGFILIMNLCNLFKELFEFTWVHVYTTKKQDRQTGNKVTMLQ